MRDVLRIGAGVAVGIGLLVAGGAGHDTSGRHAPALDDADDVEAPVVRPAVTASPAPVPAPPPAPPVLPPVLPSARAGWKAGAHPPAEVVPSVVVKAARRRAGPPICASPAADGAEAAACSVTPAPPAVEIQWNAPGSTP